MGASGRGAAVRRRGIDRHLPQGGLPRGHLHEVIEGGAASQYAGLATLFVAGILARMQGPVLWCLRGRDLFAPALARVGLHPDRVIFCETWKDRDVLARDGRRLRSAAASPASSVKSRGFPSMPRAAFNSAPGESGVTALVIRRWRNTTEKQTAGEPNAAATRWRIAPSSFARERVRWPAAPALAAGSCCGSVVANRIHGFWRHAMRRVISLYLPHWPSDRLRRAKQRRAATG